MQEPNGYVGWTAAAKADWLWTKLIKETTHRATSLPQQETPFRQAPLTEAAIVLRRGELSKALTRTSDLMEPGRPKLIHARGTVAQIRLVTHAESPYTGLLSPAPQGGAVGLLRVSQVARVSGDAAVTPAMALKLLIDGNPSADVLAMNHTVGQGRDHNLFSNPMSNDLTETHDELRIAQRVMSFFFNRISHQPRRMISDHLAAQFRDGSQVEGPRAPDSLEFRATVEAKRAFTGRAGVDFRVVLADLEPDTAIYDIVGISNGQRVPVGQLLTTSRFVSSDGGDRLFFRHVHHPDDQKFATS